MTAANAILSCILRRNPREFRHWRPDNDTDPARTASWIIGMVAAANEASDSDAETDRDVACLAFLDVICRRGGYVQPTVADALHEMGQAGRVDRWRELLRGDATPTDAEREAYQQWTGEEWEN